MKSRGSLRRLALPLIALEFLATTGCLKDRDYDDWRRDKLAEDLATLEPAAGSYRGTLTSKQTGLPIGALEIVLSPQIKAIPGSNGEKADGAPTLSARINFQDGDTRFAVTAWDSYFDELSGRLEITLSIARTNGRTEQLVLSGLLASETLDGNVEFTGASELAASFVLKRNSTETISQIAAKIEQNKARDLLSSPSLWKGSTQFTAGAERPVSIIIIDPNTSPEEQFLNRFAAVQVVQFTLNYGDSVKLVHDEALWDRRTGRISGRARIQREGLSSEIITECQSEQDLWTCSHQSQGLGMIASTRAMPSPDSGGQERDGEPPSPLRDVLTLDRMGTTSLESGETPVWLKATLSARSREQEFWELFVPTPERTISASLQFGIPGQPDRERLVILFEKALLDLRSHTLDGRALLQQGLGSSFFEITFRCENFRFPGLEKIEGKLPPTVCQYWSSHRPQKLTLVFP